MTNDDSRSRRPESPSDSSESGLSRRGLLRVGAGIGVAGVAGGLLVSTGAGLAGASTAPATTPATGTDAPDVGEPMVAHVHDVRTGEVDLFVGERHVRFTDPALAARMARLARNAR
ncbi:MAG: hypothetical protein ACRDRN_03960 [Sciscionella sp.]